MPKAERTMRMRMRINITFKIKGAGAGKGSKLTSQYTSAMTTISTMRKLSTIL